MSQKLSKIIYFALALFCYLKYCSTSSLATNYYVSPAGNDSSSGVESSPYRTVTKALTVANPGDTVYLRDGVYKEPVAFNKTGTAAGRIVLTNYPSEIPVIDGSGVSLQYDGLVQVRDNINYITINGLTIKNSPNMGLANRGSNNIITNNKILLSYDSAIWHRFGTNTIFKNNEIFNNVRMFANSANETAISCNGTATWWPATLNSQNSTGATWEGNYVHNNCGEGIVGHTGDKIIANTFRDNWSVDVYLDNGTNILVDRNFITDTNTTFIPWPGDGRNIPVGIAIADELTPCATFNNTISNNVVVNTRFGVSFYPYVSCSGIIGTKIVNNTFVNTWEYGLRLLGPTAANSSSLIANNIVYTTRGKALIFENPADTIVRNNIWYVTSGNSAGQFQWGSKVLDFAGWNSLNSQIVGNIWADPLLLVNLSSDPGSYTSSNFYLKTTSPAIDKGFFQAGSGYPSFDYANLGRPAGSNYDIGAFEYQISNPTTSTPTPVPGPKPGDANNSNTVDESDFTIWKSNYLNSPSLSGYTNGDFDNSSLVDGVDYMIWAINYGK